MGVQIYRWPTRSDDGVDLSVSGETLSINGVNFDLSVIDGPATIDSPFVIGLAFRQDGDVHVKISAPYKAGEEPVEPDEMPRIPATTASTPPLTARQLRLGLPKWLLSGSGNGND